MLNQIQDLLQHQTALLLPDLVIAYHTQFYSMVCDNMKSIIVDDNLCQDPLSMSKFSHKKSSPSSCPAIHAPPHLSSLSEHKTHSKAENGQRYYRYHTPLKMDTQGQLS